MQSIYDLGKCSIVANASSWREIGDYIVGASVFEPANQTFWNAVKSERPELYKQFTPWDRIGDRDSLKALLESSGGTNVEVFAATDIHQLATAEDWWTMLMGGGTRGTIDQLDPATQERVGSINLEFLRTNNIHALNSDVLYGIAHK